LSDSPDFPQETPNVGEVHPSWISTGIDQIRDKCRDRRAKRENETPQDRFSRRLANATVWMAIFTAAVVGVGFLQFRTLDKTDQTLKAAQRPWVSVGPVQPVSDFEYTNSGASLAVAFGLSNYGHSPALNVEMDSEMRIFASGSAINFQALKRQNIICDRLRTRPIGNSGNGFTLIPNGPSIYQEVAFSVSRQEINNGTVHFPNIPNMAVIPLTFLIGCVRYVFYADSSQHETGGSWVPGRGPGVTFLLCAPGDISILRRHRL